jgi:hypothetical protein
MDFPGVLLPGEDLAFPQFFLAAIHSIFISRASFHIFLLSSQSNARMTDIKKRWSVSANEFFGAEKAISLLPSPAHVHQITVV